MFEALRALDFSGQKGSVRRAHDEAWYWFKPDGGGGLHYPRLSGKVRTRAVRRSLFWFRADARFALNRERGAVVRRARQLAAVMGEAGVEVRELWADDPGRIVWEDYQQVLAEPSSPTPRAF